MDYDKIVETYYKDMLIDCGIVQGNCDALLIKVGQNGSIRGYQDKYIMIAKHINEKYGLTVVVSENPYDRTDSLQGAIDITLKECGVGGNIYYVGMSNGAILGARYGYLHPEIKRMLLINGPLMINWPQTRKGIEAYQGERVVLVYAEKDPSYQYVPILDVIDSKSEVSIEIVPNTDHVFVGAEYVLQELIEKLVE